MTKQAQAPKQITLGDKQIYVIDYAEMFCGDCDEYVTAIIEVDAWTVDGDGEPCEPDYDDTVGTYWCPNCESEALYEDEDAAADDARYNYECERADAIRKGEW